MLRSFAAFVFVIAGLIVVPGVASAGSTTWQAPQRLGADLDQSLRVSAANEAGAAVSIWSDYAQQGIFASYRSATGAWSPPEVAAAEAVDDRHVAASIAADGVVTLVYKGGCGPCGMRVRRRAANGTWSAATELEDFDPLGELVGNRYKDVTAPAVASGPGGRVTAVWSVGAQDVKQQVIRTSTFEDGSWSAAETISGDLHADDDTRRVYEHRAASRVAFDPAGRTLVLWTHSFEDVDARDDWAKNMVHFETAGRAAGSDAFVRGADVAARTATEQIAEVQMDMADDGVATFVWSSWQTPFDGTSVHARRRSAAGVLGAVTPVVSADGTSYDHLNPKLAVTPDGDATASWTRSALFPTTAVPDDVLTRTWNADGSWQPSQVAGTGLTTEAVDVAAGRDGTIAVAWQRSRGARSEVRGFVRLRRPDGTWADAVTLAGPDAQRSLDPFVAVEGDGDALAIWRSQSFDDATFTQTDFVEAMATGSAPPDTPGPQTTTTTPDPPLVDAPPFIPQAPREYSEIRPLTPAEMALRDLAAPAAGAVKAAPKVVKASTLLQGKLDLTVKPTTPNIDVRGAFTLRPAGLISDNGLGLISDNGLGIIGSAAGNIIGTACCNLIGTAAGNIISQNHANRAGPVARSAATLKLTVLAKARRYFATPKAGKLRLKVGRKGRAAIRRALRKPGRQTIKMLYLVGLTERGSAKPTVFSARLIKLRE